MVKKGELKNGIYVLVGKIDVGKVNVATKGNTRTAVGRVGVDYGT